MAAPSYKGPTVVARCLNCGHYQEIPDPDALGRELETGGCEGCDGGEGSQLTEKEIWRGPVTPIPR